MVEDFITPPSNSDTRPVSLRFFADRFVFRYILEPFPAKKEAPLLFERIRNIAYEWRNIKRSKKHF